MLIGFIIHHKINWVKACNTGRVCAYQDLVASFIHPLLRNIYDSIEQLDNEIVSVSQQLIQAAYHTLPILSSTPKERKVV